MIFKYQPQEVRVLAEALDAYLQAKTLTLMVSLTSFAVELTKCFFQKRGKTLKTKQQKKA